jgi:hypothetical protein
MATTNIEREGTAGAPDRRIGNRFISSRMRPPPAFYGVPAASDEFDSDLSRFAPGVPVLVSPQNIRLGMEVYDYDGMYVGFVTDVLDTTLRVRRRWRAELEFPLEQVLAVLDQRVVLTVSLRQGERDRRAA